MIKLGKIGTIHWFYSLKYIFDMYNHTYMNWT